MSVPVGKWVTCTGDPLVYGLLGCQPGIGFYITHVDIWKNAFIIEAGRISLEPSITFNHVLHVPSGPTGLLILYSLLGGTRAWEALRRVYGVHAVITSYTHRVLKHVRAAIPSNNQSPPGFFNEGFTVIGGSYAYIMLTPPCECRVHWGRDTYHIQYASEWPVELARGVEEYASGRMKALEYVAGMVRGVRELLGL